MLARKCVGTKKATFQSIIVLLEVSISAKKYRQKIRNRGDPPPLRTMSPIKSLFFRMASLRVSTQTFIYEILTDY